MLNLTYFTSLSLFLIIPLSFLCLIQVSALLCLRRFQSVQYIVGSLGRNASFRPFVFGVRCRSGKELWSKPKQIMFFNMISITARDTRRSTGRGCDDNQPSARWPERSHAHRGRLPKLWAYLTRRCTPNPSSSVIGRACAKYLRAKRVSSRRVYDNPLFTTQSHRSLGFS